YRAGRGGSRFGRRTARHGGSSRRTGCCRDARRDSGRPRRAARQSRPARSACDDPTQAVPGSLGRSIRPVLLPPPPMTTPFQMPTEEELRESALAWIEPLRPCLYENWPQPLQDLSFRTVSVPLTKQDIEALLPTFDG